MESSSFLLAFATLFLRKQNLQLQCKQDILIAAGEKKNVKDKSNLLLINKLKIEANTIADKLGKI